MHITSLPSPYGIGDLGEGARRFADFLTETKQSYWQILPANPTLTAHGNSPYSSISAFAGNPFLISPDYMVHDGMINEDDLSGAPDFLSGVVDYEAAQEFKEKIFHIANSRFRESELKDDYARFCSKSAGWLNDFSLFMALKNCYGGKTWYHWPEEVRNREPSALQEMVGTLTDRIEREKFLQYIFFRQWTSLKEYCNDRDIRLIGDIQIYVNHDSADAWRNREIFKLDKEGTPLVVAGVPPDYFSTTGQLWGNPVYRWDIVKEKRFDWWVKRFRHNLELYDLVRIDHFRGYVKYWEVPFHEKTAVNGKWVNAPGDELFTTLLKKLPCLPVIAEDLGRITPEVQELLHRLGFPGVRPVIFAFGETLPRHKCAPHNIEQNSVVYTGTHDCNTVRGWFDNEATRQDRRRLSRYLGKRAVASGVHRDMIRLAMGSVANTAILPMQDILGLGQEARMNVPGTTKGNWQWRLLPEQITTTIIHELREITEIYGRSWLTD